MSIGGDSSLIGKDLGNAGGWYYVAGTVSRPHLILVRRLSVVSDDPSFSNTLTGKTT